MREYPVLRSRHCDRDVSKGNPKGVSVPDSRVITRNEQCSDMLVTLHFASTEVGAPATDSAAQQRLNLDRSAAAAALILAEGVGAREKPASHRRSSTY